MSACHDPGPAAEAGAASLSERAREALRANDRGGYTVPSPRLYPFQWNWDSAVVALGWMTFDEPRAWLELDRLLSGQWRNGLLPHIVFHRPADTYFPGPEEWGLSHLSPPTSSISQPPLLATIVRAMAARARDGELARQAVARLVPRLLAWHRWWLRDRDPSGTGLAVIFHPWESGMDNSPAWDGPLAAVPPARRAYVRRDIGHIDAGQRPDQADYDRYVHLLDLFRELRFDPAEIHARCPFRVADFGLNAILARATEDLAALCAGENEPAAAAEMRAAAARTRRALEGLWSDRLGQYVSLDTRTGNRLEARTHSTFLAWYAGLPDASPAGRERERRLAALLDEWQGGVRYGVSSVHPAAPAFNPRKYWRGPVWPHLNWLIARGLGEQGHPGRAERLRAGTRELVERAGLREYFHPGTGEGFGGDQFAWTAAVTLFWTAPESEN